MSPKTPYKYNDFDAFVPDAEEVEQTSEDDLWFLPVPMEEEPEDLPLGPRAER